jgi:hypothetical protein
MLEKLRRTMQISDRIINLQVNIHTWDLPNTKKGTPKHSLLNHDIPSIYEKYSNINKYI